jgi:hypothetical protein
MGDAEADDQVTWPSSLDQIGTDGADLEYSDSEPEAYAGLRQSVRAYAEGDPQVEANLCKLVASVVDPERDPLEVRPVFVDTHSWDGSYPRHPLVTFLPAASSAAAGPEEDPRLPRNPRVPPYRIT